jgi:Siphovirus Gp157
MTAPVISQAGKELFALLQFRDDVKRDADMTPQEQAESLEAIEGQIRDYLQRAAEDAGVVMRRYESFAEADRKEAKYYRDRAEAWDTQVAWLKGEVLAVMEMIGAKKIEGPHSTLKVVKNPPSVDVAQRELVPAAYQRRTVTVTGELWDRLLSHLFGTPKGSPLFVELQECKITDPEPMKDAIKKELKAGVSVPGCRLIDDKVRLEVE